MAHQSSPLQPYPDEPPPSYEFATQQQPPPSARPADFPSPSDSHMHDRHAASPSSAPPLYNQTPAPSVFVPRFPTQFGLYRHGTRNLVIGHSAKDPVFFVERHPPFDEQNPSLTLHSGPAVESTPMASADWSFATDMVVALPSSKPAPASGSRGGYDRMVVRALQLFPSKAFVFAVETGPAQKSELYEWRRSRGPSVQSLGGDMSGYKLLRKSRDPPPGFPTNSAAKFVPGGEMSSDGYEVVAVVATSTAFGSRVGRFAFVGTGAVGVLGGKWALAAAITGVSLIEMDRGEWEGRGPGRW